MPAPLLPPELAAPFGAVETWLKPFGLSLTLDPDTRHFSEGQCGEYEDGSVFEKDITIRVHRENIRDYVDEQSPWGNSFEDECSLTVYHEVGHALVQQLVDYSENIAEFLPSVERLFGDRFFDVFNDDNLSEEELVEDFAYGFLDGTGSTLQECAEACLKGNFPQQ